MAVTAFPFPCTSACANDKLNFSRAFCSWFLLLPSLLLWRAGQLSILQLCVRRSHVYDDTMAQLAAKPPSAWTLPLRVEFKDEEGIDEGGLVRPF